MRVYVIEGLDFLDPFIKYTNVKNVHCDEDDYIIVEFNDNVVRYSKADYTLVVM